MEMSGEDQESDASLIALTTHFAQVQFRLKQIISAEPQQKEALLKELEGFAFQGCNKAMPYDTAAAGENGSTEAQKRMRAELMERLRTQLDELEQYAHEASENQPEGSALSGSLAEKQQIIIDGLRRRFDLQFGDLEQLSKEEVEQSVDRVVHKIIEPIRTKDELLTQLQTQVQDLERYIDFLRADPANHVQLHRSPLAPPPALTPASHPHTGHTHHPHDGTAPAKSKRVTFAPDCKPGQAEVPPPSPDSRSKLVGMGSSPPPVPSYHLSLTQLDGVRCSVDATMFETEHSGRSFEQIQPPDDLRLSILAMRKTLAVMQLLTLWQCGGSFRCLPRYAVDCRKKKYQAALHCLELAVDKIAIITAALNEPGATTETCVALETDLHEAVSMSLADSLRILLEHGLLEGGEPVSYSGGCVPAWSGWGRRRMMDDGDCAGWRVFKHYYSIKHGREFGNKPEQLLSSSFALPQDSSSSMKKTLLGAVHRVEHTYSSCQRRAKDTKFRALICEGFNVCHLAEWFRIISTHPSVAEDLYSVTSFLATTGFRPALAALERLKDNPPCQPVRLPQEHFQFTEAFSQ